MIEDIYELFVDGSLLDDLIQEGLITPLFWTMLGISFAGVILFYYIINSTRFCRPSHWLLTLFFTGLLVFITHLGTCFSMANKQIPRDPNVPPAEMHYLFDQGSSVFFSFALEMFGLAALLFFLMSMAFKWGSRNASRTPF
ncbi:hypothetical protein GCM10028808_39710 [Spirosoma migulaei]